jgi:ABC-2 type transport system permease protein
MKEILRGVAEQLRVMFGSRLGLSLLALLLAMSVMTGAIFNRLVLQDVRVVVVDLDATKLTRLLTASLDATPELAVQPLPGGSVEQARERLERGEVAAYVLLPAGFTERLKRGEKSQLLLATDMSNLLAGKTVRAACSRVVATLNVGAEMSVLRKMGSSRRASTAQAYPILVEENQLFNPATNYAEYLVPSVVYFLLHIYATVLFAGTFLQKEGALTRLRRLGQLVTTWFVSSIFAALTWWLLPFAHTTMASPWWLGSLVFVAYAASQAAFVVFVAMLIPSSTLAFQAVLFLSMLGLMLSGVTWPTVAFPPLLATLAEYLPFTHLARLLRMTVHFEASVADVLASLRVLLELLLGYGFAAVAFGSLRSHLGRWFGRATHDISA